MYWDRSIKATEAMDYVPSQTGLSQRLINTTFDGDDPSWAVAAKQAAPAALAMPQPTGHREPKAEQNHRGSFVPREPLSFREAGLSDPQVEALVLKFLLNTGGNTGREIADQVALPFGIVEPLLRSMKHDQLVVYRSGTPIGDYTYELTSRGAERARSYAQQSTYFGTAPVTLADYIASVDAQSLRHEKPRLADLKRTFGELVLGDQRLQQLGEAMNLGLGFFLHGPPGNGKTSIAERVTAAFGEALWIPRAINAGGEIIRVYDPSQHELLPWNDDEENLSDRRVDRRWVRVRRPTIIVGGELQLENLEVTTNPVTGISEAPIQLKSTCGTLVIDDFGRQKFDVAALLNRLIIPLERRIDILNLPSGRSFRVPFDLMVVFATNLEPESLVDEAFLRRVPFTIAVDDPTEIEFREVFRRTAQRMGLKCEHEQVDYLLKKHYRQGSRKLRFCHPRDLLQQVRNSCDFLAQPMEVTNENLDGAVKNCLALRAGDGS